MDDRVVKPALELPGIPVAVGAGESVVEEFLERRTAPNRNTRFSLHRTGETTVHGPLPIIIGITGHRDLRAEDIPRLEELLRAEFAALCVRYPSTSFILLSALADGADRLCSRIAIEVGMRLIIVLPMPIGIYETDFDDASRKEFHAIISKAEHSFELPLVEGQEQEDILAHGPGRERQYAQCGAFLAMHCTILVALWDGVPLQKIGGTSNVVRFRLEGVPEPYAAPHSELDAPDNGPVYHIVTPRYSNPNAADAFQVKRLYPKGYASQEEAEQAYRDIYERMEMLNRDAVTHAEELKENLSASKEYIFPTSVRSAMPTPLRETLDFYSIADVLSQRFQRRTFATLKLILTCVFLAVACFEVYSGPLAASEMLMAYLAILLIAFGIFSWAKRQGYQTKYLDYRALAEGLRIQFFWKLAGLKDSVADFYMRKQRSELDWIRNAVRSCMTETCPDETIGQASTRPDITEKDRLKLVLKYWVEDQANYFARAAHRDHKRVHCYERTVSILFAIALFAAGLQAFVFDYSHYLVLGVVLLSLSGALLHEFLNKNAFSEHTRQYDRMSAFFNRAKMHLEKLIEENRIEDAQRFVAELGREALAENGDWILTHRDRPLEVPQGA